MTRLDYLFREHEEAMFESYDVDDAYISVRTAYEEARENYICALQTVAMKHGFKYGYELAMKEKKG